MKAIISRSYYKNETIGSLIVMDGEHQLLSVKTIELPNNGNQHNTSCIPEGHYEVIKYDSPGKGKCFKLMAVPDRSDILIHVGNYVANDGRRTDSLGCILVGKYFTDINNDGFVDICESRNALNTLLDTLPDSFDLIII